MLVPPFTVSALSINLIWRISALMEHYAFVLESEDGLCLRKTNLIQTIHSSLAIEGNQLAENTTFQI